MFISSNPVILLLGNLPLKNNPKCRQKFIDKNIQSSHNKNSKNNLKVQLTEER